MITLAFLQLKVLFKLIGIVRAETMTRTCPNCGTENRDNSRFCKTCGSNLDIAYRRANSRNRQSTVSGLGDIDSTRWIAYGSVLGGASLLAGGASAILFFLGTLLAGGSTGSTAVSSILGILSSLCLILLGYLIIRVGFSMKFPSRLDLPGYLVSFYFILTGIGSIVSALPVSGSLLVLGGVLLALAVNTYGINSLEGRVWGAIVALIGALVTFLGFVVNPVFTDVFSASSVLSDSTTGFPQGIYVLYGFLNSYAYIGFIAAVVVLMVAIFNSVVESREARNLLSMFSGMGLLVFSAGEVINGYYILGSQTVRSYTYPGSTPYSNLFLGFQFFLIGYSILLVISGFLLLIGSLIFVSGKSAISMGAP